MKISIRNIGPVKEADIELVPLTIFIGPNNSGKSVLATTLYALLTRKDWSRTWWRLRELDRALHTSQDKLLPTDQPEIERQVRDYYNERIEDALNELLSTTIHEMERATGTSISDLRRKSGARSAGASIIVTRNPLQWQESIRIGSRRTNLSIDSIPDFSDLWSAISERAKDAINDLSTTYHMTYFLVEQLTWENPQRTKYLPAGRSGILQSHKPLTSSLVRSASFAGVSGIQVPAVTGIIADFLGEIIELRPNPIREGPFAEESERMEREILHGQIGLKGDPYPEVVYRDSGGEYSTGRTSSMVSELAPVVLYLRYLLSPGDLLIIEEPEAHLHPASQVAFARCLVRLVNRGLRICLTTHSEFFLQQINNAIMASALTADQTADLGVSTDRLDSEKVAAYFFDPGPTGTIVRRLSIDPKAGIPEASFDAVTEQLYNETISLDESIGGDDE